MQNEALSTSKPEDTNVSPALPDFYTKRNLEYSKLKSIHSQKLKSSNIETEKQKIQ
jgi:hypothetical protein